MAQVYGQIESQKKIRQTLNQKGIDGFQSVNQINKFLEDYESELKNIHKKVENGLEKDITELEESNKQYREIIQKIRNETIAQLDAKISLNQSRVDKYSDPNNRSIFGGLFNPLLVLFIGERVKNWRNNYNNIISKSTFEIELRRSRNIELLNEYVNNKEKLILERSFRETKHLEYTKEALLELNPLIAGAVGENLVVKEIEKLSDEYILINDFSLSFNPPIYNKQDGDRIFSIQIDHLLISRAGVFVLETKNWSKESIRSLDLRSPIDQIKRTSYALFVILNNSNKNGRIRLNSHHWGSKQIPIRNVIVMIKNKPKEDFKFVKVKTLNELNRYVTYFDPIFSQAEVESIAQYFVRLSE